MNRPAHEAARRLGRWPRYLLGLPLAALATPAAFAHTPAHPVDGNWPRPVAQFLERSGNCQHFAWEFGGDGSRVFTRTDRRIHTPAALLAQVQGCNQRARSGLSAEDEQSVAAWLNERYYKFK